MNRPIPPPEVATDLLSPTMPGIDSARMLSGAGVGLWVFDIAQDLVHSTSRACALMGLSPTAAGSWTLDAFLHHVTASKRDDVTRDIRECAVAERFLQILGVEDAEGSSRLVEVRGERTGGTVSGIVMERAEDETLRQSLHRSVENFQALFDSLPIPAFVYDPQTLRLLRWNDAALRVYNVTAEEASAHHLLKWLAPSDADRLREYLLALSPDTTARGVWRLHLPDGREVDVETSSHQVIFEGKALRLAIAQDVTEQMAAQRAIAVATEAMGRAVDARRIALVGHWQHDVVRGRSEWSDGAYRVLGLSVGAVTPSFEAFLSRVHPDDVPRLRSAQYYNRSSEPVWEDEYRVMRPDGTIRLIRELGEATFGLGGQLLRLVGIVQDVTETREVERQVEAHRVFLREIIDSLPICVAVHDRRGRLVVLNKTASEILGWEIASGEEEPTEAETVRFEAENAEVLNARTYQSRVDECVRDRHGQERFLTKTQRLIDGPEGANQYVLTLAVDTTQRRQEELRRREMEKLAATGRMAARVAHEINNPLAGIKSAFCLVKDEIPSSSPHQHYMPRIEREIDRIAAIVRQMFDLYRPLREPGELTDVDALLDDVAHLVQPQVRERQLRLEVLSSPKGARIPVEDAVLRPVVFNVLQNAIEASSSGMLVRMRATVTPEALRIEVSDEGSGIDASLQAHVFEPFFTTKNGLASGGLGLGLSIARSSVESLNGTLTFVSNDGPGTTFVIRIPVG